MGFGKYAIIDEVEYNLEKEPEWYWRIKPPTAKDALSRDKYFHQKRMVERLDGTREFLPAPPIEVAMREIALCFGGTNIPDLDISPGDPISKIEGALGSMPVEMLNEIWSALGEAVPGWGPALPKEIEEEI